MKRASSPRNWRMACSRLDPTADRPESSIARVPRPFGMPHTSGAMSRPIPVSDLVFLWAGRREAPASVGVVLLFQPPPGLSAARALEQVARAYRSTPPTAPFD